MKKNVVLIAVVVVLVVAGLGVYLVKGSTKPSTSMTDDGASMMQDDGKASKGETFSGKLKEAIMRNIPMKCSWKSPDGKFEASGYIKNTKYYGEVKQEGKQGHVIIKDNCMWTWEEANKQGVKMCFEGDIWENQENVPQDNYNCVPATVSDSKFTPPPDVNFMDIDNTFGTEE